MQNLTKLFGNRLISLGLIQTKDRLEADRLEVAFYLRFLERVCIDELAIDSSPILSKRSGSELENW